MTTKLNSPDLEIDDTPDGTDTTLIGAIAQSEADKPVNAAIVDEIEAVEKEAVEKLHPCRNVRNVYEMARDAIVEIERMAGGMVADRIEITACENRISAAVRDEECNEVTFSRRLEEGKMPHNAATS